MLYADSSFLVSAFGSDVNSADAVNLLATVTEPLVMTELHRLEITNAWELAVFRGRHTRADVEASAKQMHKSAKQMHKAVRSKALVAVPTDWAAVLRSARQMARTHSASLGTRSYDITHVATARHLRLTTFYSFDKRQRTLAAHLGMKLEPATI